MLKKKKTTPQVATDSQSAERSATWAAGQIGYQNYFFLVICICAQLATVLVTWSLWEVRQSPINLPWIEGLPQIPFGILIVVSLVGVLISPRRFGLAVHLVVLAAALLSDQIRCQPQVLWVAILTIACVYQRTKQFCVWALVSLWLWAGVHKALSSEWSQNNSWQLLYQAGFTNAQDWCHWFALLVTISEIAQGVLAILRPRIAAVTCVLLHLGITGFMIYIQCNFSVLPWNICTAIVGAWLMLGAGTDKNVLAIPSKATGSNWLGWTAVAALLILPAGFYTGHVRHCFAHVLYSGELPQANISRLDGTVEELAGWDQIGVPFPAEPKAFRDYFRLTSVPGEKLHIHDVRPWVGSRYYQLDHRRQPMEIARTTFYRGDSRVPGIGCDDRTAVVELTKNGTKMKCRTEESMIFAVVFSPEHYSARLLDLVNGLPNVEEIQLRGCDVRDADLKKITTLTKLKGIGLNETPITRKGLQHLSAMKLELIEFQGETYTEQVVE